MPEIVVVGAAARDLAGDDPRGWRLGGGVAYSALTVARLGVRTGALIGVDAEAATASELDLLRDAGVEVVLAPIARGPVFENIERPEGRLQFSGGPSDPVPTAALPAAWATARGWILAPVAAELRDDWADAPPADALVAVGWQGLLRVLEPDVAVRHVRPFETRILRRADLVGVSRDDVDRRVELGELCALLRPGATLAVTHGEGGGLVMEATEAGPIDLRHYPAITAPAPVDPTGAGDVFLAALTAARRRPGLVGGRPGLAEDLDLRLAAAASSCVLEGPGLLGVADRVMVRRRAAAAPRPYRRAMEVENAGARPVHVLH